MVKRFDSGPVTECFELRLAWHPRIRSKISNFRRATLVTLPRIVTNNGKILVLLSLSRNLLPPWSTWLGALKQYRVTSHYNKWRKWKCDIASDEFNYSREDKQKKSLSTILRDNLKGFGGWSRSNLPEDSSRWEREARRRFGGNFPLGRVIKEIFPTLRVVSVSAGAEGRNMIRKTK